MARVSMRLPSEEARSDDADDDLVSFPIGKIPSFLLTFTTRVLCFSSVHALSRGPARHAVPDPARPLVSVRAAWATPRPAARLSLCTLSTVAPRRQTGPRTRHVACQEHRFFVSDAS